MILGINWVQLDGTYLGSRCSPIVAGVTSSPCSLPHLSIEVDTGIGLGPPLGLLAGTFSVISVRSFLFMTYNQDDHIETVLPFISCSLRSYHLIFATIIGLPWLKEGHMSSQEEVSQSCCNDRPGRGTLVGKQVSHCLLLHCTSFLCAEHVYPCPFCQISFLNGICSKSRTLSLNSGQCTWGCLNVVLWFHLLEYDSLNLKTCKLKKQVVFLPCP